jgi:hypothetical protein
MQELGISSHFHLKAIMNKCYASWLSDDKYCQTNGDTDIERELALCYQDSVVLSYDDLKAKLRYMPIEVIKKAIASSPDFIQVSKTSYTHISKIEFDEKECNLICANIPKEVSDSGFVSLKSFTIPSNLLNNPDIPESTLKNIIFQKYLSDRFELHNNLIALKGSNISIDEFIKQYCLSQNSIQFKSLMDTLNFYFPNNHSVAIQCIHKYMIRIREDLLVADCNVDFDIDRIDQHLAKFVNSYIVPLQAINNFTLFPYTGYPWNWFLLESFCRRFSKLFRYSCLHSNNKNLGAICKASVKATDYLDVLTQVVITESVPLDTESITKYLVDNKYVSNHFASAEKIRNKAKGLLSEKASAPVFSSIK